MKNFRVVAISVLIGAILVIYGIVTAYGFSLNTSNIQLFNYIVVDGKEYEVQHDRCESYHSSEENTIWVGCYLDDAGVFVAVGEKYFISKVNSNDE